MILPHSFSSSSSSILCYIYHILNRSFHPLHLPRKQCLSASRIFSGGVGPPVQNQVMPACMVNWILSWILLTVCQYNAYNLACCHLRHFHTTLLNLSPAHLLAVMHPSSWMRTTQSLNTESAGGGKAACMPQQIEHDRFFGWPLLLFTLPSFQTLLFHQTVVFPRD